MFRLLLFLFLHLGERDRRKGSHPQRRHGNRFRMELGKRILARLGGSGGSKKTSKTPEKKKSSVMDAFKDDFDDDDPFEDAPKSKEDKQRERYEEKMLRDMERAERSRLYSIVQEAGGLKTNDALREEYAGISNNFKRKDGLAGDEMADYLNTYYPELGIEDERDLIDFLAA